MAALSVVVPFHDVAEHFEACLESLRRQTFTDLEVVLVDDGSTDGSHDIAVRACAADPRFRLVVRPNGGPGPARNYGVEHATGEYLAFADADDVVHRRAYARLVGSLIATGSDFGIGAAARFNNLGVTPSYVHQQAVTGTRLRTHVSARPELALDRMAWNKVYRRSFWDAQGLEFAAILMQDYPVSVAAHARATAVDVLDDVVYYWRERDGGVPSITQRSRDLDSLRDRVTSALMVLDLIAAEAPASLPHVRGHLRDIDLPALLIGVEAQAGSPAEPEVRDLAARLASRLDGTEHVGSPRAERPRTWVDDAGWSDGLFEIRVVTEELTGDADIALWWEDANGSRVPAAVTRTALIRPYAGPARTELRTALDPVDLEIEGHLHSGFRVLRLQVTDEHGTRVATITEPSHGRGRYLPARSVRRRRRVLLQPCRRPEGFGMLVHSPRVQVDRGEVDGDSLVLSGRILLPDLEEPVTLVAPLCGLSVPVPLERGPHSSWLFCVRIPAADVATDPDLLAAFGVQEQTALYLRAGTEEWPVAAGPAFACPPAAIGHRSVGVARTPIGTLVLVEQRLAPEVTGLVWTSADRLLFTGRWNGPQVLPPVVHLRYGKGAEVPDLQVELHPEGDGYGFEVDVAALVRAQVTGATAPGTEPWHLLFRFDDHVAVQSFDREALASFAVPREVAGFGVSVLCTRNDVVRLAVES